MKAYRNIIFILVTVFAILIQLANPTLVRADDGTPPPSAESETEVAPPEEPVEPPSQPEESATEAVPAEEPAELSVATEAPAGDVAPVDDPNASTEIAAAEEPTVSELIEQIPEQTDIVVLDETGQVVPLATQEAANIILVGDPVWCPTGQNPGGVGCSGSYINLQALIADVGVGLPEPTLDGGVIWIKTGADTSAVVNFDGASWATWDLLPLTLQGGWDGAFDSLGTITATNSIFTDQVEIFSWNNRITVNNISFNNIPMTGTGLFMYEVRDVVINNSIFSGNNYGLSVFDANNFSISNSTFSGNNSGAVMDTVNNFSISNSTFSQNTYIGADIYKAQDVTIADSTFSQNTDGAHISRVQDVIITGSVFSQNTEDGMGIYNTYNNVTITGSTFSQNTIVGAFMSRVQDVTIADGTFNNNGNYGAYILNVNDVSIVDSNFNGNARIDSGAGGAGIDTANHATISNSNFNENDIGAVLLDVNSASITGSAFSKNRDDGLYAYLATGISNITISNSTFSENAYDGINVRADDDATINLTIDCDSVSYQNNGTDLYTEGNVFVNSCGSDDSEQPVKPDGQAVISVPSDQDFVEIEMDCSLYNSYLVQWVGGDRVVLSCVEGGRARVSRVDNTTLPRDLPASFEYASAIAVEIFQNGVPLDILSVMGVVQPGFISRHETPNYAIMYWDEENGEWIVLKDYQLDAVGASVSFPLHSSNPQDVYRVLSGARPIVDGTRYREEVTTNFPGLFVLAQQ